MYVVWSHYALPAVTWYGGRTLWRAVLTSQREVQPVMPKILYDIVPGIWILACSFRIAASAVAKIDRMILGRRAIDKARPKDLPAIVDALGRWQQDHRTR